MILYSPHNKTMGYKRFTEIDFFSSNFSINRVSNYELKLSEVLKVNRKLRVKPYTYKFDSYLQLITNAIIDLNVLKLDPLFSKKIELYINRLEIKNVVLIVSKAIFNFEIFSYLKTLNVKCLYLLFEYEDLMYSDKFAEEIIDLDFFKKVIVFNSPFDKNIENMIFFYKKALAISSDKSLNEFNSNLPLFTESQAHHTYFNRKLYIGPNGEIKNAPECEETFGYIQDLESPEQLKEIVQTPAFQKYWYVHKEITDVCKDCEFRHMCVDNRLPYQRAENEWYHKQECNYNPYIAKWKDEEGYRTLADCGVVSNENGFSIDHDKIAKINEELWGES